MKNLFFACCAFLLFSIQSLIGQDFSELAKQHILSDKSQFPEQVDYSDLKIVNQHTSKQSRLTHIYVNQTHDGIKIYNAISNIALDAHGKVFHVGNRFVNHATKTGSTAQLSSTDAVNRVAQHFGQDAKNETTIKTPQSGGGSSKTVLLNPNISVSDISAELLYVHKNGQLILTWSIAYQKSDDNFWWDTKVNAHTGELVEKTSWTVECNFDHGEDSCEHGDHSHSMVSRTYTNQRSGEKKSTIALAADDYRVVPIPNESPSHSGGVTSIVTAPWTNNIDPNANPFTAFQGQSWHHDGSTTHFTTRGNNVWAVEDTNNDNNQATGFSPNSQLGGAQQYDFTPNFANTPSTYQDAAITNLFYWNNLVHDIMYPYGFNEDCGNFQESNPTGLGIGSDAVQADAQDGSGTNNANFGTPPDGQNPRMQMFEWTQPVGAIFSGAVSLAAAAIPDGITGGSVTWVPAQHNGALVLVSDIGGTTEACGVPPPGNISNAAAISGNVALIDRGVCPFSEKIENAEAAGAISVVICNNAPGSINMGGASTIGINIPAISISLADCNTLKANLAGGINVSFNPNVAPPNRDSDYDNGVIIHEYGHGISTRLTGGAANSGCLGGDDQMGEGWSDYFGLILTMKPGDTGPQSRGIGTYLLGESITGNGIRPFPYSNDFAINPMTYTSSGGGSGTGGTLTESIPHGVGSVWCTMLWDMTWEFVNIYGIGTNIYDANIANAGILGSPGTFGGQNLALQLVIEALKLQPCSPGFVDGRDAILAADKALYGGIHSCLIWEAFARRGLGLSAEQGSSGIVTDNVEAFDVPTIELSKTASTNLTTDGSTISYDFAVQACGAETNISITDIFDPALTSLSFVSCTDPLATPSISGQTVTISHPGTALGVSFSCTFSTVVNSGISASPTTLFMDDVESGNAGWTINNLVGGPAGQWVIDNFTGSSPTSSWLASNTNGPNKTTALESPPFNLTNTTTLEFFHRYDTEDGWDGGFLEISTNGGASWVKIPNSEFIQNGYNGGLGAGSNAPIAGDAWTGLSAGFIETKLHLGNYAPSPNAQIRFVFGQDDNTNSRGWWVDDIAIIQDEFAIIPNIACATSDQTTTPVCDDASICVEIVQTNCVPGSITVAMTQTDASCNGFADGTATATPTGGVSPYTYLWSDGSTTMSLSGLAAGSYSVIATDAAGCTGMATVTIMQPALLSISASETTAVACTGDATGVATAVASGGTSGYTYAWPSGGTNAIESGLAAGSYDVTVTDANGCIEMATVMITEPASAVSVTATETTPVACTGDATGVATAVGAGGTAGYSYAWPSGGTAAIESGLVAGPHMVTVTDANGCTAITTVTITEPSTAVSVTASETTAVACTGDATGVATAVGAGGIPGYTYMWPSGGTTNIESGLAAGSYSVTVTDTNGCTAMTTVSITEPALAVSVTASETTAVACAGDATGIATAVGAGGTSPYSYVWPSGGTTAAESGLLAGNYTVTITDSNGCTGMTSVTITEPATSVSVSMSFVAASCGGATDGSATATATGGVAPYTYSWSTGTTTATATGLSAGAYTAVVTDANGCTANGSVTITSGSMTWVAGSPSSTDASCTTGIDGSASASAMGGTSPYTYVWSNGMTGAAITGLAPGTYTVVATDAIGCTLNGTVTVGAGAGILVSAASVDETCLGASDGSATATATGGTGMYTYAWPSGGSAATETGLTAGNYVVTATDPSSGCTAIAMVTIGSGAGITVSATLTDETCAGSSDGTATASAANGSGTYTYAWSSGGTAATETGLTAGTYSVTATDSNSGCTAIETVTIGSGAGITVSANTTDEICLGSADGSATASAANGSGTYTYAWSSGGAAATETGLTAGTYSVTATDSNSGCTAIETVTIGSGTGITVSANMTDETCVGSADGTATASAANGSGTYTYAWSSGGAAATETGLTAGTFTVTATDTNSGCTTTTTVTIGSGAGITATAMTTDETCAGSSDGTATVSATGGSGSYTYSWSSGGTAATETGLAPGSYTVTVTDSNLGCQFTATTSINPGTTFTVNTTATSSDCIVANGSATAMVLGATGSLLYSWSNGASGATITNIPPGSYTVMVTESPSACAVSSTVVVSPSGQINWVAGFPSAIDEVCFGDNDGAVGAAATGGVAPYTYQWEDNAGNPLSSISGLSPGMYHVTATDVNGCFVTGSTTVNPGMQLAWSSAPSAVDASCPGANDGAVSSTASGGTSPYTYTWQDSNGTPIGGGTGIGNGSSTTLNTLQAGTYCVTVTDANGCTLSGCVTVGAGAGMSWAVVPSATDETCLGINNGSVTASATGGIAPITYFWTNTAGNQVGTSSLPAGTYTVIATDAHGCSISGSATVAPGELEYSMANGNMLTGTQTITEDFEVDGMIESDQLVTGGASVQVDYDSGTSITMKPGFEVTMTTVFHAFIDGCGGSMLQQNQENR